jgi:uncharacterized repeat protein (TIGR03803 family)
MSLRTSCLHILVLLVAALGMPISAYAQTESVLYSFQGTSDGGTPVGLVQGTDGNFYGTTSQGGTNGYGTVFKLTPAGVFTTLASFSLQYTGNGSPPYGLKPSGLIQARDGNFYGVTYAGGTVSCPFTGGCGSVFRITPSGALTYIYSFSGNDGAFPTSNLVLGSDGNLYGTALQGGNLSCEAVGCGTAFGVTTSGTLTMLATFGSSFWGPNSALAAGSDGNFYGTDSFSLYEGSYDGKGVFRVTPGGTLTSIYTFIGYLGNGSNNAVDPFYVINSPPSQIAVLTGGGQYGGGTIFEMTYSGTGAGGEAFADNPTYLIFGSNGVEYITTASAPDGSGTGTVTQIPNSGPSVLVLFNGAVGDAQSPSTVIQGSDGNLYGVASGGASANGAIYKICVSCTAIPLPAPAQNVAATLNTGGDDVQVSWSAASGATAYQIEVSTSPTSQGGQNLFYVTGTSATIPLSDLAQGTTYYVYVVATNHSGETVSAPSASFTTPGTPVQQSTPTLPQWAFILFSLVLAVSIGIKARRSAPPATVA